MILQSQGDKTISEDEVNIFVMWNLISCPLAIKNKKIFNKQNPTNTYKIYRLHKIKDLITNVRQLIA